MKGLLKKDLLLLKSQIKYIVTIVVICLIMAYANSDLRIFLVILHSWEQDLSLIHFLMICITMR